MSDHQLLPPDPALPTPSDPQLMIVSAPTTIGIRPSYETLRALTKRGGPCVADLLALSAGNDPFYAGQPALRQAGEWFAHLWAEHSQPGRHLRGFHYVLVSQRIPPALPDGTPYLNTEACWAKLQKASTSARYLGLVRPEDIVNHRNPPPHLYATRREWPAETGWYAPDPLWSMPAILTSLGLDISLDFPEPEVSGYDYLQADQPYLLEVWIEKSTMDDILLPVCERLGMNLVTGVGYLSVTRVVDLLRRVTSHGKPARILYISDHDPSGEGMPIQAARQAEFWLPTYAPTADVKLTPIALDAQQVAQYGLPRAPIKETNLGKASFEERHGAGAVELDALEALYPGALARLLRAAAEPYSDRALASRLWQARQEAKAEAASAWEDATGDQRAELATIDSGVTAIAASYGDELRALSERLEADLEPFAERLEALRQAIALRAEALEVALPDRPEPETAPPDEGAWLFDSGRDYFEQLDHYKARREVAS